MKICRTCLKDPQNSISIFLEFEVLEKKVTFADLLQMFTGLAFSISDSYTDQICYECAKTITNFLSFRTQCINIQNILSEITDFEAKNESEEQNIANYNFEDDELQELENLTVNDVNNIEEFDKSHVREVDEDLKEFLNVTKTTLKTKLEGRGGLCYICGEHRNNLRGHMTLHDHSKLLKCEYCSKSFPSKSKLELHIRTHTGVKDFKCSICGKTSARKGDLVVHMRMHTGEKPFQCHTCGQRFIISSHLNEHRANHLKDKPFQCPRCPKSFNSKSKLTWHKNVHRPENYFECDICHSKYVHKKHLTFHKKKHFTKTAIDI